MLVSIRIIFAALLLALGVILVPQSASAEAFCGQHWGSLTKSDPTMAPGEINGYRTGQHDCYDRLVVDIDGAPGGYQVGYVSQVTADGSGAVVSTPGGAKLQVVVRNPSFAPHPAGARLADVAGYRTFRSVVWAGSFEGQTTLGLGVRARLPFRVFTLPGAHGRLVVDVAHRW